jgi:hypothetical protein
LRVLRDNGITQLIFLFGLGTNPGGPCYESIDRPVFAV